MTAERRRQDVAVVTIVIALGVGIIVSLVALDRGWISFEDPLPIVFLVAMGVAFIAAGSWELVRRHGLRLVVARDVLDELEAAGLVPKLRH